MRPPPSSPPGADPSEASASALPEALDPSARGYRLANAVSYFLNPLVLPPVAFALVQWHFGAGAGEIAWTFGISLVFFCLVPLLYVVGMLRRGEIETLEIRRRERRLKPFLVGIVSFLLGMALLALTTRTATLLVVLLAATFPINTALVMLINTRWKISVHMTSLAGFVSFLLFTAVTVWRDLPAPFEAALTLATTLPLLLLLPLLMWARVRVGAHTLGQVVGGTLFGLLVPFAELYLIVYKVLGLA